MKNLKEKVAEMLLEKSVGTYPMRSEELYATNSFKAQHNYSKYQEFLEGTTESDASQSKLNIVWKNVLIFSILHLISVYGIWLMITQMMWRTFVFFNVYAGITFFGVTAGAHRLWSHRSYKAKLPLRIFLMVCQSATYQNHIYEWVRDHRVHHKYTDTDADPHNARRGFFFSHIGWIMVRKHKDVINKGKTIDLSDLEADPVVMFQKRYYFLLVLLFCFIIPSCIPPYFWGESLWLSWIVVGFTRYTYLQNCTFLVNSLAHIYGMKPYDKHIKPVENKFVAWLTYGEGWHNYHHAFPWDYKTAELGNYSFNISTAFIDLMATLGQAYDLKTTSPEIIKKRVQRTGDGSWKESINNSIINGTVGHVQHHIQDDNLWGWGDKDMKNDDVKRIKAFNKLSK